MNKIIQNASTIPFKYILSFWLSLDELKSISIFREYIIQHKVARKKYLVLIKVRYSLVNYVGAII